MVQNKNKNQIVAPDIPHLVSIVGTTAMLAASLCGLIEHMDREGQRLLTALQPSYTTTAQSISADSANDDQLRRAGREEILHASTTYGAIKRTPSVAGTA